MKVIGAKKRTIYIGYDGKTAYIVYDCTNSEDDVESKVVSKKQRKKKTKVAND